MLCLGFFGLEFKKAITEFGAKIKILKSRTKNALFGYICARILKNYCYI